jgi:hypothetical protein
MSLLLVKNNEEKKRVSSGTHSTGVQEHNQQSTIVNIELPKGVEQNTREDCIKESLETVV